MFFRPSLPHPVRRIVVLTKHHYMGDTIVAVPLLRATRRVFPEAHITLVTGRMASVALQECPYMDAVHCYSPRDRDYSSHKLRKELCGNERPDVLLVVDRSFRSAWIAFKMGATVRAGFATEGRGFLLTHRIPYNEDESEIECFLDILRSIAPEGKDIPVYDPTPELFLTDSERRQGWDILRKHEATDPILVGMQPGASYAAKQWEPARFAAVATKLTADGFGIVLVGSGKIELEAARLMRQAMPDVAVVDLTGSTTLRETMAVLSHLSLFIGNDTGVNHIAASLGVPTIGLFGPTRARKWGHSGPHGIVLTAPDNDLGRLDVLPVLDAARQLLHRKMPSVPVPVSVR